MIGNREQESPQHELSLTDVMLELGRIRRLIESKVPKQPGSDYMTVREAADFFKLSPATLYQLKHLQVRRGRSVRFRRSILEQHFQPDPFGRRAGASKAA